MLEIDYGIECPYCSEQFSIKLDLSAGDNQQFVYDCEICCRPIDIDIELENGKVIRLDILPSD